jgi:membrane protein YdbS with pleckstrin-like domain
VGYVQQNLNPGERILYTTHLHWIVLFRSIFVDALFSAAGLALIVWGVTGQHTDRGEAQIFGMAGVALIIIGNIILAIAVVRRNATEMAVTNKRIIIKVGFLTKRTVELFLSKVESVGVEQTLLGRMMGYGGITVRGTGGTNEPFSHVANPLEFRRQVQHQIEEHLNPSPEV